MTSEAREFDALAEKMRHLRQLYHALEGNNLRRFNFTTANRQQIDALERRLLMPLPAPYRRWLLAIGHGAYTFADVVHNRPVSPERVATSLDYYDTQPTHSGGDIASVFELSHDAFASGDTAPRTITSLQYALPFMRFNEHLIVAGPLRGCVIEQWPYDDPGSAEACVWASGCPVALVTGHVEWQVETFNRYMDRWLDKEIQNVVPTLAHEAKLRAIGRQEIEWFSGELGKPGQAPKPVNRCHQ
jgi:hypothetical protein